MASLTDRFRGNPNQQFENLKALATEARRHQDREVWLNVAFYLGEHYVEYATLADGSGKLVASPDQTKLPTDQREARPVVNKIMHYVNQNLSFAMQSRPTADVLPASDDPLSLSDSNVANAYVEYVQEPNVANWEKVLWDANLWALVANEAYVKWCYNPDLKRPDIIFCPSTDIYSDPYARDFYKARWVIHSQFLDPEQVYDVYGVEVKANQVERAELQKTEMLREMGQSPVQQGVTVNELWMKPSRRHPKGLFTVWAGRTQLIPPGPFPYEHGGQPQLPFTQIGVIPRPNSKHYAAPVTFLRAPQVELNRYHAQRILTRENWALLKLWLPEGVELEEPWDNSPNQVLKGSSSDGSLPQIIGPPGAMPDNNDGDWIVNEMSNVIGLHEVSQGQVPGRVEAAKAIELLKESDTSRLAVLTATTSNTIAKGFWQTLMLTRQYNQEEIVVESYSKEGAPEVHRFFSESFKPGMRIRVTTGSGLAFSRAARLDQLTTLWEKGVLRDPEEFGRLADIPTSNIISVKAYDVRLARNENLTLANAQAITANSWDDHTIHIREHNAYRKTSDFAAAAEEVKTRFEHHVTLHKNLEMKQLQEEAQKAMLLQQSLGGGGAPQAGGGEPAAAPGGEDAAPENFYKSAAVGPGATQG